MESQIFIVEVKKKKGNKMTVINKWHYSAFLCLFSVAIVPLNYFFATKPFQLETSVWCMKNSNQTKICKFKNICYDSQFKTFLFFLGRGTVIKGLNNYIELQKIQLSSLEQHNQFYANMSMIKARNFKLRKKLQIYSKGLLFSRFKPNNIMHSIHDDIFPMFLTLEFVCLGDKLCMESHTLLFHDKYPRGPFFNLYKMFSRFPPILLNELILDTDSIFCFEEMLTGLILDGIFYQYGFKKPHGPVKSTLLTQNDVVRFVSFIKSKMQIEKETTRIPVLIILKRQKNRKILNINELKQMAEDVYGMLNKAIQVKIVNLDLFKNNLKDLIIAISQADGLIGMHGAEMILSLFLKPNSYVFEIFPFGIKPDVVSFIKPISELDGCHFSYFPWRNFWKNNSVAHPDAHPLFGGISYLDEVTQSNIKNTHEVPPLKCCNNPLFLYYMYQDTLISNEFRKYLYKSLANRYITNLNSEKIIKFTEENWYYPNTVCNVTCSIKTTLLQIDWQPPLNVDSSANIWYSLYIQDEKGLFTKNISTNETIVETEVPFEENPVFEIWISAYLSKNNFRSPDSYIKCY